MELLYQTRDGVMTVVEKTDGVQVSVGKPQDFRSADLGPEEIAHLAHALNKWVGRFTSRA